MIYGINRRPATLDIFMNFRIMTNIKIQRIEISTSPAIGDRKPKNAADQSTLRKSWTAKI